MLPDSFIMHPFALTAHNDNATSPVADLINEKLLALEGKILSSHYYAGQSRNRLLEETDQHIKTRLLCAIRIETLHCTISELIESEVISKQELNELLSEKTDFIRSQQQTIWLNQLTQEKKWPLYYSFEEGHDERHHE